MTKVKVEVEVEVEVKANFKAWTLRGSLCKFFFVICAQTFFCLYAFEPLRHLAFSFIFEKPLTVLHEKSFH